MKKGRPPKAKTPSLGFFILRGKARVKGIFLDRFYFEATRGRDGDYLT